MHGGPGGVSVCEISTIGVASTGAWERGAVTVVEVEE